MRETVDIPTTIFEENLEASDSESNSDTLSEGFLTQPTNLTNNPTYQTTNHPSSQQSTQSRLQSSSSDSQSSQATIDAFQCEFGDGGNALAQLQDLERDRATILKPVLEEIYAKIECTEISRHMWAHVKDMQFNNTKELYSWIRSKWEISIVSKSNVISCMMTANTRNCSLCMQEHVKLFYDFNDETQKKKLMNSRTEFYGNCSCKTRFLRLSAVGIEGADET